MGYLLILAGIGLIGLYIFGFDETSNESPHPPASKLIYGGVGVGCFLLASYLLYNVGAVWEYSGWKALVYLIFTGALVIAGGNLIKAAYEADQKEAQDMKSRAEAKAAHTAYEQKQIELESARKKAEKDAAFEEERRRTEAAALANQRRELDVRNNLAPKAENLGLDVNTLISENTYANRTTIDLQRYAGEKEIDFRIRRGEKELEIQTEQELIRQQLEAADRVEHYRIVDELEDKLEGLFDKRREIEQIQDEVLKQQKLTRLDKRIAQLEADIDGRQNRLLSSSDGKETKRLT